MGTVEGGMICTTTTASGDVDVGISNIQSFRRCNDIWEFKTLIDTYNQWFVVCSGRGSGGC